MNNYTISFNKINRLFWAIITLSLTACGGSDYENNLAVDNPSTNTTNITLASNNAGSGINTGNDNNSTLTTDSSESNSLNGSNTSSSNTSGTEGSSINTASLFRSDSQITTTSLATGKDHYEAQCTLCHGDDGQSGLFQIDIVHCQGCDNLEILTDVIDRTMPTSDPSSCTGDCASDVANYIYIELYNNTVEINNNSNDSDNTDSTTNSVTPSDSTDSSNNNGTENSDNNSVSDDNASNSDTNSSDTNSTTPSETENNSEQNNSDTNTSDSNSDNSNNTSNDNADNTESTDNNESSANSNGESSSDTPNSNVQIGKTFYDQQCALCHDNDGTGGISGISLVGCTTCGDHDTLSQRIIDTMPTGNVGACGSDCANPVAEYILAVFNSTSDDSADSMESDSSEDNSNSDTSEADAENGSATDSSEESSSDSTNTDDSSDNSTNTNTDNSGEEQSQTDTEENDIVDVELSANLQAGKDLYDQQCSSCHGATGTGGITGVSLIQCVSCGDHPTLTQRIIDTMPTSNTAACGADCADPVANYILEVLNDTTPNASINITINQLSPEETLQKAARNYASRAPTEVEMSYVEEFGEAGLDLAMESLVNDKTFCSDRMKEIYNEQLRIGSEEYLRLYRYHDFPNFFWYLGTGTTAEVRVKEDRTKDAIIRQPLHHIAYVACNDLPFSEILTADYMVVNPYSAQSLGFTNLEFDNPEDPDEFKPVQLIMNDLTIPHAGILTTPSFLRRYPTTDSNLNRGRAYRTYLYFLATDILTFNGFQPILDGDAIEHPEVNNPNCNVCHQTLDPVAQSFYNWENGTGYSTRFVNDGSIDNPINEVRDNMWPIGFETEAMPDSERPRALAWVAERIGSDPRFAKSVVLTLFKGITGEDPLTTPSSDDTVANQAFLDQQRFFDEMINLFVDSGLNVKTLAKALVINNPYFRANSISEFTADESNAAILKIGLARILTPSMMTRKLHNTFWFTWITTPQSFNTTFNKPPLESEIGTFYGKLDVESDRPRLTTPNGVMAAIQQQMSTETGHFSALHDFALPAEERKLFMNIEANTIPFDADGNEITENTAAIRATVEHLHQHLYGEVDLEEVEHTYQLFLTVWNQGHAKIEAGETRQELPIGLNYHPITHERDSNLLYWDREYVIRAWGAILTYMINDYQFLYE